MGKKFLMETHPITAGLWHHEKNKMLLSDVTSGMGFLVWWRGSCGHEWERSVWSQVRTEGRQGCAYCSGRAVLQGFNDLMTTHPELGKEWHSDNVKKATEVRAGSAFRASWVCGEGHVFVSAVYSRAGKSRAGCPVCAGRLVVPGGTDLMSVNPELAMEWNSIRNHGLTAADVLPKSSRKVWWVCGCGHEWEATVSNRSAGKGCPACSVRSVVRGVDDAASTDSYLLDWFAYDLNEDKGLLYEVSARSRRKVWWRCLEDFNHVFFNSVKSQVLSNCCPECSVGKALLADSSGICCGVSGVQQVKAFVSGVLGGTEVVYDSRSVLPGYELDIYVPSKRVAVEFNGIYWHSESVRANKNYHKEKWLAAKEAGIQLIQVWEDEWTFRQGAVKRMLSHKLGCSSERVVFARRTEPVVVSYREALPFLEAYHIQGAATATFYVALVDDSREIVAVMLLKATGKRGEFVIERYATSCRVTGGFGKLLRFASEVSDAERLVTFSDNCVSDGALYLNAGFVGEADLRPDYKYMKNDKRYHKFGFRVGKFRSDPALKFEEGLTEYELARLNNMHRVWDAGKVRWVKSLVSD